MRVLYATDKKAIEGEYNNLINNKNLRIWPVDSDNRIWLHYKYYKGIRLYKHDNTWSKLDLKSEAKIDRPSFLKDEPINILSIIQTKYDNTLWISTDECLFKFKDGKWSYFTNQHSPCFNVRIGVSLWELPDGTIFARNDEGLAKYKENDQWETIKEDWVNVPFLYDNERNLWALGKNEFLVFGKQSEPRKISTNGLKDVDYLQLHIRDIFSIDKEKTWFCAEDILTRYDSGKWESFTVEDVLPGQVFCAAKDPESNKMWFGTAKGLYFLDQ